MFDCYPLNYGPNFFIFTFFFIYVYFTAQCKNVYLKKCIQTKEFTCTKMMSSAVMRFLFDK